jgi:hypothetical protein
MRKRNSVVQTSDGGYALAGRTKSYGAGNWDFYLVKADSNGALEWQEAFGGALDDGAYCVIETSDGGLALAGYSHSYTSGGYDMWLVKVSVFLPPPYSVTVWSWDSVMGWLAEPITMDGVSTGYSTPHTFADLVGNVTFTVPSTDAYGSPFKNWSAGETSTTLTVGSEGTYTAQYYKTSSITIWAWDNSYGWLSEPITMDGVSTGFSTPHTFTDLSGSHSFAVPSNDTFGNSFVNWTTNETSPTLIVGSDGTYTAQYYYNLIPEFDSAIFLVLIFMTASALTIVPRRKKRSACKPRMKEPYSRQSPVRTC